MDPITLSFVVPMSVTIVVLVVFGVYVEIQDRREQKARRLPRAAK